jgi:DTW domain-containing protein YfiP
MSTASRPRPDPSLVTTTFRETCLRCRRPTSHCWCDRLPRLTTKTRVVFLQHPRERDTPIGTARMAHLSLPDSILVEGIHLDDKPVVQELFHEGANAAVLFPGPTARPVEEWAGAPPATLVVLDGTWWQARKLLKENPRLASLPRISYRPPAPGNYRIRKEPDAESLATIEAVSAVLGILEGDREGFARLLEPFTWMVDRQLEAVRARPPGAPARHRRRSSGDKRPIFDELFPLLDDPARAVLLFAEANSHGAQTRVPGVPEVLHVVGVRPSTGERYEAVLRPRRPLGSETSRNLGISPEELLAGEEVAPALARLNAFLSSKKGTQLVMWGPYARDLLANEGEPSHGFVDLRALAVRALGRRPGGIPGSAEKLGVTTTTPAARGRAGRMMMQLEGIYGALVERAQKSR